LLFSELLGENSNNGSNMVAVKKKMLFSMKKINTFILIIGSIIGSG